MVIVDQYRDLDTVLATLLTSSIYNLDSEDELQDANVARRVTD